MPKSKSIKITREDITNVAHYMSLGETKAEIMEHLELSIYKMRKILKELPIEFIQKKYDFNQIVKLYNQGKNARVIAEELSKNKVKPLMAAWVRKILKGYKDSITSEIKIKEISKLSLMLQMCKDGKTYKAIAEELSKDKKISRQRVQQICRKYGIKKRCLESFSLDASQLEKKVLEGNSVPEIAKDYKTTIYTLLSKI